MTANNTTDKSWSRRTFLKGTGAGIACLAAVPCVWGADRQVDILGQAEDRIARHRKGTALLRLTGPDGQAFGPGVRLRISQTRHKFLFGCNIFKLGRCRTAADNAAYERQFAELLNYATLSFYWWTYEFRRGQTMDERTDEVVRWCKAHDVATKGHPLAWNYVDPRWLAGTPEEVMDLQLKRVERCVQRFKGDIDIWDVVNEVTEYDRGEVKNRAPKLTEAIAKMGVGEYVRQAFTVARKANPQATLLINDYRTGRDYADKVLAGLVDGEGKPFYDVIGIQSHMHGRYWGAEQTWDVCERFAKFGKPLHFTETTVVSGPRKDSAWVTTSEGEQQQAEAVTEFYTVLFSHPAVTGITWWDFTDQGAWQRAPAGLVRDDMTPKPAYERLHDLIKGKWWTQTEVETGPNGQVSVEGFYGQYKVNASVGDRRLSGQFSLDTSTAAPVDVRMADKG
ncbi:MAG: endo-1,4-beta-xylanase [Sedimentisphaerales bacterium]|nr:endo-1,4-beta-xylanase [Sedimentisphaerales bacterium]